MLNWPQTQSLFPFLYRHMHIHTQSKRLHKFRIWGARRQSDCQKHTYTQYTQIHAAFRSSRILTTSFSHRSLGPVSLHWLSAAPHLAHPPLSGHKWDNLSINCNGLKCIKCIKSRSSSWYSTLHALDPALIEPLQWQSIFELKSSQRLPQHQLLCPARSPPKWVLSYHPV